MISIANKFLSATVNPLGAELTTLTKKDIGLNYIWKGDPQWWGKHSPVLFPIVGSLKNDQYIYEGKSYNLPRHGFARERNFTAVKTGDNNAKFTLSSDEESLKVFPFDFRLELKYTLVDTALVVNYTVINTGNRDLYFCIGAHPAFAVPLESQFAYEDYYLEFEHRETSGRYNLANGLLMKQFEALLINENKLKLTPDLFVKDAIVLKHLKSDWVSLKTTKSQHGFRFTIAGWPYLGIWAAANAAPFVCIEPWQGYADEVDASGELKDKPGVVSLEPSREWQRSWAVELF